MLFYDFEVTRTVDFSFSLRDRTMTIFAKIRPSKISPRFVLTIPLDSSNVVYRYDTFFVTWLFGPF